RSQTAPARASGGRPARPVALPPSRRLPRPIRPAAGLAPLHLLDRRWPGTGRRDKEQPVSQGVFEMSRSSILLDGNSLTLEQLERIAAGGAEVALAPAARDRLREARALVDRLAAGEAAVYGINTGFGNLAEVRIAREDLGLLQRNLILSHAAGVGEPLSLPETRALLALRVNVLAKGHSGIRPETVDTLLAMLAADVLPVVPSRGSVGASG